MWRAARSPGRPAHWRSREAPEIYLLGHENLQREAIDALGPSPLAEYRHAIDDWAAGYRTAGWPPDTPQFLLRGYFRLVQETGDVATLADLAVDPARHDRLLDVSGGDLAAMGELDTARTALLDSPEPDLLRLITLETYRDTFRERNKLTPERLPAVWAELGQVDHAVALAQSITEPWLRTQALVELVGSLACTGEAGRAKQVAEDEHEPQLRDVLLAQIPIALARAGRLDEAAAQVDDRVSTDRRKRIGAVFAFSGAEPDFARARRLAAEISDEGLRDRTLGELGRVLAAVDPDAAVELAGTIADGPHRGSVLAEAARSLSRLGHVVRAREVARECGGGAVLLQIELAAAEDFAEVAGDLDEKARQQGYLPAVVAVLADTGRWPHIPEVLVSMTDRFSRDQATLRFIRALVAAGETERAFEWAARFQSDRPSVFELRTDLERYVVLADELLAAGEDDRARVAAERAETLVRRPAGDQRAVEAIGALTATVVAAGDVRRAELLAPLVRSDLHAPRGIEAFAKLLAAEGDPRIAEKLICGMEFWPRMRDPLALLARRLRAVGDHAALARLAARVRGWVAQLRRDPRYGWEAAIVMLCAVGETAELMELVAAYPAGNSGLDLAVTDGVVDLAARGEAAVALQLCALLPDFAVRTAREALASGLAEAGFVDQAEAVVDSVAEDHHRERLLKAFLPKLAGHDLARALDRARRVEFTEDRAQLLVGISAAAPPDERRRILAEAVSLHHWSVVVPALDADELAGLLGVVDRFGALYHHDDHQDDHQDDPDV
ncbi:hypothetical protein AB0K15_29230 [Amycolatopsis sp. NPDC049253]|uniref:hypothetical protein n=1 Tax=Amycolatopsis sp. NPDC049253 TaxID=3155274 RepID=UPI0034302D9E